MKEATQHMAYKTEHGVELPLIVEDDTIERWSMEQLKQNVGGRCIILINDLLVDVTSYLGDHVRLVRVFRQSLNCFSREALASLENIPSAVRKIRLFVRLMLLGHLKGV